MSASVLGAQAAELAELKKNLRAAKVSQKELADRLGLSQSAVSNIFAKKRHLRHSEAKAIEELLKKRMGSTRRKSGGEAASNSIKFHRTRQGMTLKRLSLQVETGAPQISRWERGLTDIPLSKLRHLSRALSVSLEDLLAEPPGTEAQSDLHSAGRGAGRGLADPIVAPSLVGAAAMCASIIGVSPRDTSIVVSRAQNLFRVGLLAPRSFRPGASEPLRRSEMRRLIVAVQLTLAGIKPELVPGILAINAHALSGPEEWVAIQIPCAFSGAEVTALVQSYRGYFQERASDD